ncbi:MAG: tetratricopeptide repeat protein [Promethearchaeota archaeon]
MPYSKIRDFSNIKFLTDNYRYKEALQELENIEKYKDLSPYEQISCYVLKSSLLFELGNYRKSLKFIDHIYQDCQNSKYNLYLIDIFTIKSQISWRQGKPKEALDLIAISEDILKSIHNEIPIELNKRAARLADIKSWIYIYEGDINKATENMEYSLKLREEVGDEGEIALSYYLKGNIYFYYRIDWDYSKKCIKKAFDLAKEKGFKSLMSLCLTRLGDFYLINSDLERTFEFYNRALDLSKDIEYKKGIAFSLGGLAYLYEQQGNLNRALEFVNKSYSTYQEMGDILGILESLDTSFWFTLNNNDLEHMKYYFNRMKHIVEQFNAKIMKIFFQLNKALFLKTSPLPSNQAKAKEILMELVKEKTISEASIFFEAAYRALLNLCDLLLNELRSTHNLELLNDIQSYIHQMLYISKNANSFWWLAETYLLQAKLELITLDLKSAEESITQAQKIAEKCGLIQLNEQILIEKINLQDQINKWKALRKSKATITELIDLAQIDDQLIRMLKRRYSLD